MGAPVIAVDFDGTVVAHHFPKVGPDVPGAVDALRSFVARGARLLLWTMRSGDTLAEAVEWFVTRDVQLWGVNSNPEQAATGWSRSPKQYAHLYIDDAALGCPLRHDLDDRPVVDWSEVTPLVLVRFWPADGV